MCNPSSEESEGFRVVKMWWNKVEDRVSALKKRKIKFTICCIGKYFSWSFTEVKA